MCASTPSNMNISKISWPIATKFYLNNHWGGGKGAISFEPDQIRTLVSMATDSSNRVKMGKTLSPLFSIVFYLILFKLAGNENMLQILKVLEFQPDLITNCRVSCP